jgi:hypothetical protein
MRSLRFVAALALGLTPPLASTAAGTVPAFAGGGAGMTLTARMEGQDQRLLVGTKHLVTITVADTPGESDLRDLWVGLDDLDPQPLTVTCPAGVNGHLSLEPGQSLQCTAVVTAEIGYRTLLAKARARVPGGGPLTRSAPLHYTGFQPPPPPPPPTAHAATKGPVTPEPAAARPHRAPPPVAAQADPPPAHGMAADPPAAVVADPPAQTAVADPPAAGACAGGGSTAGSGSGCKNGTPASTPPKHDGLAHTGMSASLLATVGAIGLALIGGGTLLIRRVTRR